jgi:hypothetical protein
MVILLLIGGALFIYSFIYKGKVILRIWDYTIWDTPQQKKDSRLALVFCLTGVLLLIIGFIYLTVEKV